MEVRGCAAVVQVWYDGRVVAEHPRHTQQRLLINPSHYDGPGDEPRDAADAAWGGWRGSSRRSSSIRWSNVRWTCMPRWRRWLDERQRIRRAARKRSTARRRWKWMASARNCWDWDSLHAAEALAEELSEAVKHDRAVHVVLDRLLSCEVAARDERRVRTSLKLSNLPLGMTLGNFDFAFQPSIDRQANRDAGDVRVHPRAMYVAGAGSARSGQDASGSWPGRSGDRAGLQRGVLSAG